MSSKFAEYLDNILRETSPPKKIPICFKDDVQKFFANPNNPTDKKKPCRYYANGYCQKKQNCLYEHVRQPPAHNSRFKTELCNDYQRGENCRYGDRCHFAHGEKQLRR